LLFLESALTIGVGFGGAADTLAVASIDTIGVGVTGSSQFLEVELIAIGGVEIASPACFSSFLEVLLISQLVFNISGN
jgi:hypothetical protein